MCVAFGAAAAFLSLSAAAAVEVFNPNRPKPQITAAQTRFRFVVFIKFCRSS
jgi:hypothetical protein